jgi:hypothetical protein
VFEECSSRGAEWSASKVRDRRVNATPRETPSRGVRVSPYNSQAFRDIRHVRQSLAFERDFSGCETNPGCPSRTPKLSRETSRSLSPRHTHGLTPLPRPRPGRDPPNPPRHFAPDPGSLRVETSHSASTPVARRRPLGHPVEVPGCPRAYPSPPNSHPTSGFANSPASSPPASAASAPPRKPTRHRRTKYSQILTRISLRCRPERASLSTPVDGAETRRFPGGDACR